MRRAASRTALNHLALEEAFGIKIPDADLTAQTFESVNRIAGYVQSRG